MLRKTCDTNAIFRGSPEGFVNNYKRDILLERGVSLIIQLINTTKCSPCTLPGYRGSNVYHQISSNQNLLTP